MLKCLVFLCDLSPPVYTFLSGTVVKVFFPKFLLLFAEGLVYSLLEGVVRILGPVYALGFLYFAFGKV
jgi:hypothetical protein